MVENMVYWPLSLSLTPESLGTRITGDRQASGHFTEVLLTDRAVLRRGCFSYKETLDINR